jgi:hypothetical protein
VAYREESVVADEVTDYVIVEGSAQELKRKVAEMIKDGWLPFGGVSATGLPQDAAGERVYAQAMVKVAGFRKSRAVTVPLVATSTLAAPAASAAPAALAAPAAPAAPAPAPPDNAEVACPHCRTPISTAQIKNGDNTCRKCKRRFVVEWGP